jgi:predicted transposase YbfD/YdcC
MKLDAEMFGQAARNHWATENGSQYVLDVTFGAYRCRNCIKPLHLARFRSFTINILRTNSFENIARELYVNALSFNNALVYQFP